MFKLSTEKWYSYFNIDKSIFIKNYKNIKPFSNVLNSLFRNSSEFSTEYAHEKLDEYLSIC